MKYGAGLDLVALLAVLACGAFCLYLPFVFIRRLVKSGASIQNRVLLFPLMLAGLFLTLFCGPPCIADLYQRARGQDGIHGIAVPYVLTLIGISLLYALWRRLPVRAVKPVGREQDDGKRSSHAIEPTFQVCKHAAPS